MSTTTAAGASTATNICSTNNNNTCADTNNNSSNLIGKNVAKMQYSTNAAGQTQQDSLLDDKDAAQRLSMNQEMCILVDEQDKVVGQASKRDCHLMENIERGLLHRAFSVILFNSRNECLLTQRASSKITFPDYYTNACCSHPLHTPLEMEENGNNAIGVKRAAQRRLAFELGIDPIEIPLEDFIYLTRILYKAPSNEGIWGEHEVDYILILRKDVELKPNENEVKSCQYLNKTEFRAAIDKAKQQKLVTPWFVGIHDKFLYQWWDNIDNLDKLVDHNTIFRL